jgi:hypothetical protein
MSVAEARASAIIHWTISIELVVAGLRQGILYIELTALSI